MLQMQDITQAADMEQYMKPPRHDGGNKHSGKKDAGFVVKDAPWSQQQYGKNAPDTSSMSDFPEFGASVSRSNAPHWGPNSKR